MKIKTHYDNLRLPQNASLEMIKSAYQALLKQYHPKLNPNNPNAEKITKIITISYQVLINPEKRAAHDNWIKEQERKLLQQNQIIKSEETLPAGKKSLFFSLGRISRTNYALFALPLLIISLIILSQINKSNFSLHYGGIALFFIILVALLPLYLLIYLGIKRLHDFDFRGWWLLIPGSFLIILFLPPSPESNRFGANPRKNNHKKQNINPDYSFAILSSLAFLIFFANVFYQQKNNSQSLYKNLSLAHIAYINLSAKSVLEKALVEKNNPHAQYLLAKVYKTSDKEEHQQEALNWFTKAAQNGNNRAQFALALLYDEGKIVTQDYEKALYWYKQAAKQENYEAQLKLAEIYFKGKGVAKDEQEALQWQQKGIAGYEAWRKFVLAMINFRTEKNRENNLANIKKALQQSCEAGLKIACYQHQKMEGRNDVLHNQAEYFAQIEALFELEDWQNVLYLYQDLAEQGYAYAQHFVGVAYQSRLKGIKKDFEKSKHWLEKAAEQGYAPALFALSNLYRQGYRNLDGEDKAEWQRAFYWLKKLAEQGDLEAQILLGESYKIPYDSQRSYQQALYWLKKTAKKGIPSAQYLLADEYEKGEIVNQNYPAALYWYKKSAKNDYAYAQYELAFMYLNGKGIEKNPKEAFYWFKKSADNGYSSAQHQVAEMYEKGEGVRENLQAAEDYFKKACENESFSACEKYKDLQNKNSY